MTEPIFKAPLPPQSSEPTPQPIPQPAVEPEETKEMPAETPVVEPSAPEDVKQKILPYLWYVLGGAFAIGLVLGMMMSGGGDSGPAQESCPVRIIRNPDIQGRFPLCGRTSRAEPCVLYMMNTAQYDKSAEDFYSEVQRLTERAVQLISIENPVYSTYRIPPGAFAVIKVPSLR